MSSLEDVPMPDAGSAEQELNEKFPNRPHNHGKTLPFHDLFEKLFNPLHENKKKPTGPVMARAKLGRHGPSNLQPHEIRRSIIERFISRWRNEVGNDIHPAFRLIVPDKDRDRAMYGLKEKAIGKLLVKVMRIDKNSDDGFNLMNWKLPGLSAASRMAGDFAGRCCEIIRKRPMRTSAGDMTIGEVNDLLDRLSAEQKEEGQIPIFREFYNRMNADEMMWLIRIILRQMKVGASENTFFEIWHPDANSLFNSSSSLRRVCWELYDPQARLEGENRGATIMQCFQPQLAQFQISSFQKMVEKMQPTEKDPHFWIEEKLDGERMQMHMISDESTPGGKRFAFWSRKAKDYTYLYGNGFFDDSSALTRHLTQAFDEGVESIILDGEMITWDPVQDAMVPFGTLKTAALAGQRNPFSTGQRPLFRVFDILYLNGKQLTSYTLRDRRMALERVVKSVHQRLEIHSYVEATEASEIEPHLRKVVAEASEGLVLKSPRSTYRLNSRNDDWMKVKPEYMTEFGESLDCIVIGGYYGSGHRGGKLSSFLCGLRVDENRVRQGANRMKCYSFFKVGGGMTASDYANIRHRTDGKWKDWDSKRPPTEYIELGGGPSQLERPDVWIMPDESVVVSVKAASVTPTDQFRTGFTLRFPRFKKLRDDKDWQSALSIQEFTALKSTVEKEQQEKQFAIDDTRRKRVRTTKKPITVLGGKVITTPYAGEQTNAFEGLNFFIMSSSIKPEKKSKAELEQVVKANGGKIYQTHNAAPDILCIADRPQGVSVTGLQKRGDKDIIRPLWLFDCVNQSFMERDKAKFIVPLEPKHMYFTTEDSKDIVENNVDEHGDSYARDLRIGELRSIVDGIGDQRKTFTSLAFRNALSERRHHLPDLRGWLFENLTLYFDFPVPSSVYAVTNPSSSTPVTMQTVRLHEALHTASFAKASVVRTVEEGLVTHIVVAGAQDMDNRGRERVKELRQQISGWRRLPHIVSVDWIEECWAENTLVDEERWAFV